MPLTNFGAVLNFAETLEREDMDFYRHAVQHPHVGLRAELFASLAGESQKHVALVQRTRRENVTEMILEPIQGLSRDSYRMAVGDLHGMDGQAVMEAALGLEERAIRYYNDAAEKIRALPEVARALKTLAKKRTKRIARLQDSAD